MIQKQHEGQGRAPQSDDLPCQPEAQMSQGDGPNGHEVPVFGAVSTSALSWTGCRPPDCPARGWRWPAGGSAGRPRCVPSRGRTQTPARRTKLGPSMWSAWSAMRPARWGSPQRLGTAAAAPDQAVAVVGYAEAVRGLAIGGSSKVGADPGGQLGVLGVPAGDQSGHFHWD